MLLQYLNTALRDFKHYKTLGEKTFSQLEEDDFFWQLMLNPTPLRSL